ncbi:hypothetical protein K443DRAFT_13177 [Laccaria amethystina LaAM-08-1]|uniref:Uncharacterized protein n=1 Tax=Laccaria amethystina LaAM-08-1 TaxID=1095629 RepID=A0A0C9X9T1_9AGAR|nr:hypothetical protein K443DRAFT_13177 [Laccaria amethystina LaAM-08-1]
MRGALRWISEDKAYRYYWVLSPNKTLDFNHHDLVDNIAIFTTHALVYYYSCDVSSRRRFSRVETFPQLSRPLRAQSILPDALPSSHGFKDTIVQPSASACIFLFLIALVLLYTVIRSIARPTATPSYDIFTIYPLFLGSSILQIGGLLYDYTVFSTPYLPPLIILAVSSDLVAVIGLLCLILSMPLAVPCNLISQTDLSPQKTTPPSGPLVDLDSDTMLEESNVWNLSPAMQSRPIFVKFSTIA